MVREGNATSGKKSFKYDKLKDADALGAYGDMPEEDFDTQADDLNFSAPNQ